MVIITELISRASIRIFLSGCWRLTRPADPTFDLTYRDAADEQAGLWAARSGELRALIGAYDAAAAER